MRLRLRHLVLGLPLGLAFPACGGNTNTATPVAFDRPEDVSFFCWNTAAGELAPLDDCATPAGDPTEGNPEMADRALFAMVTQTTTGEIAAVRITGELGEPGVVDSDVRLPGFTFAAVGEVPSAMTYDFESGSAFVVGRGVGGELFRVGVPSIVNSDAQGADVTLVKRLADPDPVRPSALAQVGRNLYVTLPETGQILRLSIGADGSVPEPAAEDYLSLSAPDPLPAQVELTTAPSVYREVCGGASNVTPPLPAPRTPVSLGATAEPWELEVDDLDPAAPVLLVADRALPIIHRIDLTTYTELAPLNVAVPTRALSLTPPVPNSTDPAADEGTDRYLYAIDETDRSVFVVHYDDADPEFGAVLPVSVLEPFDRMDLPFGARALETMTPGYDGPDSIAECVGSESGPAAVRGVFLAVGSNDGTVRFVDVYDADLPCRGTSDDCPGGGSATAGDELVAIARHHPRIGTQTDEPVTVDPDPEWQTTSGTVQVRGDGTNSSQSIAPNLLPLECPGRLGSVYGDPEPLLCAVTDPWAATSQTWTVAYDGTLPFTSTTGASLQPGTDDTLLVLTGSDACERGVLGSGQVPTDGPLAGYAGDVVVITADLPPSILALDDDLRTRCEEITARTAGGDITPLVLPIREAAVPDEGDPSLLGNVSRFVVGPPLDVPATVQEVLDCYPELVEIEVRAQGAFVVSGSLVGAVQGFVHPIARNTTTGLCEVDADLLAENRRGRAFFGQEFNNGGLAFSLGEAPPQLEVATLTAQIREVPIRLALDVSSIGSAASTPSLLVSLAYNDVDERLYVVDQAVQGLLRVRLRGSVAVTQTFR